MPDNFDFIIKLGGTAAGQTKMTFDSPQGMTTDGRFLWVCDTGNNRVKKLKLQGLSFVSHYGDINVSTGLPIAGTGNTGFDSPEDIVYSPDHGLLFVSDTNNNRIKLHRAYDMAFVNEITGLSAPRGLAVNRQYLWCADSGNSRIVRIKLLDLSIEQATGSNGSGNQQLDDPKQIAYDPHEKVIYVADTSNLRILKWDSHGLMTYRDKITGLASPVGVGFRDHIVYVMETNLLSAYAAATLARQDSQGSDGTGNLNIKSGGYVLAYRDVLFFTDLDNNRLVAWRNYNAKRALTPDSDQVIPGSGWFDSPLSPISDSGTAIGADLIDRERWTKAELAGGNEAWVLT